MHITCFTDIYDRIENVELLIVSTRGGVMPLSVNANMKVSAIIVGGHDRERGVSDGMTVYKLITIAGFIEHRKCFLLHVHST